VNHAEIGNAGPGGGAQEIQTILEVLLVQVDEIDAELAPASRDPCSRE
jgi:hypothetical protein